MMRPGRVLIVVLAVLGLPAAMAAIEAAAYYSANRNTGSITSSGITREYVLYVPPAHDAAKPAPLVISMHGAGLWPSAQRDISRWNTVADEHGFIVVYPLGLGVIPAWQMNSGPGGKRDARFLSDLIDTLSASHNIDPARIYADGLSNGGGMAFVASCLLPERIAAVGMVGAALLQPFEWCPSTRPVPVMMFHGTNDTAAPYHGGTSWVARQPFAGVPAFADSWSRRNGCAAKPTESRVAADVTRRSYTGCSGNADVVLYTIHDGGHTWPDGGPLPEWFVGTTTRSINASRELWNFYREHPLRPQPATAR
jgi:polyhydroxybutyrate depolymerase